MRVGEKREKKMKNEKETKGTLNENEIDVYGALMGGNWDDGLAYALGHHLWVQLKNGDNVLKNPRSGKAFNAYEYEMAEKSFNHGMWDYVEFACAYCESKEAAGEFVRNHIIKSIVKEVENEIVNKVIAFSENERR